MMLNTHSFRTGIAIAVGVLCASLCAPVVAEVSTDPLPRRRARTLMMDFMYNGITDGADPIPAVSWQTYRNIPAGRQLNKHGATRPDGRPDVIYRLPTAAPLVVWAFNNGGGEHDIAFAAWENEVWGPTRFLTHSSLENDLDPRIFFSRGGRIHIVWTVEAVDGVADSRIMLASLIPGAVGDDGTAEPATWTHPVRVSPPGEQVARPTVAESHGFLWIAYERILSNDSTMPSQIVVQRHHLADSVGVSQVAKVLVSTRPGVLNPLLTAMHGQLWLDWARSDDHFGVVRLRSIDLEWSSPHGAPWSDPSWVGIEDVRQTIRRWVLSTTLSIVGPADSLGVLEVEPEPPAN